MYLLRTEAGDRQACSVLTISFQSTTAIVAAGAQAEACHGLPIFTYLCQWRNSAWNAISVVPVICGFLTFVYSIFVRFCP
jgi:hypothetical protein